MSKKNNPVEVEKVAAAYVENTGNVSATARQVQMSRQRVMKILDRSDFRDLIIQKMKDGGINSNLISQKIREGLDATMMIFVRGVGWKEIPDFKTRERYIELALKLYQVDITGRGQAVSNDEMLELSDKELKEMLEGK